MTDTAPANAGFKFFKWKRHKKQRHSANSAPNTDSRGGSLNHASLVMPRIVDECISYLEQHGIELEGVFRLSGNQDIVRLIKTNYVQGKDVDINSLAASDPHVVSGALKLWLRELDEALLTYELYECWIAANGVPTPHERMDCIRKVIGLLPPLNKIILDRLMSLLHKIAKNSSVNKMTATNLAIVFAPTILRPKVETFDVVIADSSHINILLETMITQYPALFSPETPKKSEIPPISSSPSEEQMKEFDLKFKRGTLRLAKSYLREEMMFAQNPEPLLNNLPPPPPSVAVETTEQADFLIAEPPPPYIEYTPQQLVEMLTGEKRDEVGTYLDSLPLEQRTQVVQEMDQVIKSQEEQLQ